jgi:hypothetical protein
MDDLLRQALDKYFADFKEYHLIILIIFALLVIGFQIWQAYFVSTKIERFKNEMKKSEIKFSRYSQLQIEALSKIYQLLNEFSQATSLLNEKMKFASPELTKSITEKWFRIFNQVYSTFSKEKYILPKDIKNDYSAIIVSLIKASKYIDSEKKLSSMFNTWENGESEFMGDEEERYSLSMDVENYKEKGILLKTAENIEGIKKSIETYFERIE